MRVAEPSSPANGWPCAYGPGRAERCVPFAGRLQIGGRHTGARPDTCGEHRAGRVDRHHAGGRSAYYWNVPRCLNENRFPTQQELDDAAPDNPVYIRPIWGFWRHQLPLESVANTQALTLLAFQNTDPATSTIEFEKDSLGELTGLIREQHFMPVAELGYFHSAPRFTQSDRIAGLKKAMTIYNSTATTSILEEHGAAQELINTYQAVNTAGDATVRASGI